MPTGHVQEDVRGEGDGSVNCPDPDAHRDRLNGQGPRKAGDDVELDEAYAVPVGEAKPVGCGGTGARHVV